MTDASLPMRRGMALVMVLWTIAVLSALAMATSLSFREIAGIDGMDRDRTKADALIEAGVEAAGFSVAKLGDRPLHAHAVTLSFPSGVIELRLSDEGGRININKAPAKVLAALFRSAGATANAELLAKAIDARRESDAAAQSANRTQVNSNTPTAAPLNGSQNDILSFSDVEQLSQIQDISDALLEAIAPMITVYGDDKVNVITAPPDVLSALPGMTDTLRQEIIAAREGGAENNGQIQAMLGAAFDAIRVRGRAIARAHIRVTLVDGYSVAASAIVIAKPKDSLPYRVLEFTPLSATQ
jgi:general secretion pathway protein K